jgi:hypothetical protein
MKIRFFCPDHNVCRVFFLTHGKAFAERFEKHTAKSAWKREICFFTRLETRRRVMHMTRFFFSDSFLIIMHCQ